MEVAMSYVSLMFCFVCPARARPHANEAKVTKNILRIDQNEAKHKSLCTEKNQLQTDTSISLQLRLGKKKSQRLEPSNTEQSRTAATQCY